MAARVISMSEARGLRASLQSSGGAVASALASHQGDTGSILGGFSHVGIVWTMPLTGGFSRDTPVSLALIFHRRSILWSHFMSCSVMTGTYGSRLKNPQHRGHWGRCKLRRQGGLGNDWEGIGHGLCSGPAPAFAWSDFGRPKSGWPDRESSPGPPDCGSGELPLRRLARWRPPFRYECESSKAVVAVPLQHSRVGPHGRNYVCELDSSAIAFLQRRQFSSSHDARRETVTGGGTDLRGHSTQLRGVTVAERLNCSPPGLIPGRVTPVFSQVGSLRRVFSGISSFPSPFIPSLALSGDDAFDVRGSVAVIVYRFPRSQKQKELQLDRSLNKQAYVNYGTGCRSYVAALKKKRSVIAAIPQPGREKVKPQSTSDDFTRGTPRRGHSCTTAAACWALEMDEVGRRLHPGCVLRRATVAERLVCSPPTKAIRAQFPAGSLRIFACGNRARRSRWSAGFLGDLQFPPPFHSGAAQYPLKSPSSACKTSMLRAVQVSSLTCDTRHIQRSLRISLKSNL
ncbi:hypothetical protein PR048_022029 [Dryococelus australis]|uniref:Uncharacterized protein n=1 Tax=Dryococelus australis TaxID=614101 RepID=A0ABQ9GZV1_9NEOP|nr:hypothetical protein PR048_022029 [Dryococelus australis]